MSDPYKRYVTRSGDFVDDILWEQLGTTSDDVESDFWQLNPRAGTLMLSDGSLPAGLEFRLPVVGYDTQEVVARRSAWD